MKLTITPQDFVKSVTMDAGWRKAKIKEVTREQNKEKTGMNNVVLFEIENGDLPNGLPDLREIKVWYSDAYPANWIPLLEALFDRKFTVESFDSDFEFDPNTFIGTYVWVEISREPVLDRATKKDTGRLQNGIKMFMNINNSPV